MKGIHSALCIALLFFAACQQTDKQTGKQKDNKLKNQYRIEGNIINSDGETIILLDSAENIIQQAVITGNKFLMTGTPKFTTGFLLFQDNEKTPIFIDTLSYHIRTWDNNNKRVLVESKSSKQIAYNTYQRKLENIYRELFEAHKKNNKKDIEDLDEKSKALKEQFIKQNKNDFIGLFELNRQKREFSIEKTSELFEVLDEKLKNTCLGVDLGIEIDQNLSKIGKTVAKQKTKQPDGESESTPHKPKITKKPERIPAPTFSGLSPEGHLLDLTSIVSQNKVTMLDFWGSWCQPCRMQNPFWIRLYKKYHSQGFEIISIAEETEESRPFLDAAIQEDGMTWKHIVKLIYHKASARDIQEFLQEYFSK